MVWLLEKPVHLRHWDDDLWTGGDIGEDEWETFLGVL
jgi:hypothetical protein